MFYKRITLIATLMLLYEIDGIISFRKLDHTDFTFTSQIRINKAIQTVYKITLEKYSIIDYRFNILEVRVNSS